LFLSFFKLIINKTRITRTGAKIDLILRRGHSDLRLRLPASFRLVECTARREGIAYPSEKLIDTKSFTPFLRNIFPVVDFITSANEFHENQIFRQPSKIFGKKKSCRAPESVIETINFFGIFFLDPQRIGKLGYQKDYLRLKNVSQIVLKGLPGGFQSLRPGDLHS